MRQGTAGLSIVEVLVAAAMLIVVLAITTSIITALTNTRRTQDTSTAVNNAQMGAELIRSLWSDPALYRGVCLNRLETPNAVIWPQGISIAAVRNLDILGNDLGAEPRAVVPNCTTASTGLLATVAPPHRRITIVSTVGAEPRTLVIQVARP